MRLPTKETRDRVLGFKALVVQSQGTVFVTHIERGGTYAVSLATDVQSDSPRFEDVADVIADRLVAESSYDLEIMAYFQRPIDSVDFDDCPLCGI